MSFQTRWKKSGRKDASRSDPPPRHPDTRSGRPICWTHRAVHSSLPCSIRLPHPAPSRMPSTRSSIRSRSPQETRAEHPIRSRHTARCSSRSLYFRLPHRALFRTEDLRSCNSRPPHNPEGSAGQPIRSSYRSERSRRWLSNRPRYRALCSDRRS